CTVREITKDKIKVKSLNLTNDLTKSGNWTINFNKNTFFWSDQVKEILKITEPLTNLQELQILIHPEDWVHSLNYITSSFFTCTNFDLALRFKVQNKYRNFRIVGKFEGDQSGLPDYAYGTVIDIHDEMMSYEKNIKDLRELENTKIILENQTNELNALIGSIDHIIIEIDHNYRFRKVLTQNHKLLFKPVKELLGKSIKETFPQEFYELFKSALKKVSQTNNTQIIEYQLPGL